MTELERMLAAHDDICPICGEGIEADDLHVLEDEIRVWCRRDGGWFDIATLIHSFGGEW